MLVYNTATENRYLQLCVHCVQFLAVVLGFNKGEFTIPVLSVLYLVKYNTDVVN